MKEASWVGVLKLAPGMEMALVRIRGRGEGGLGPSGSFCGQLSLAGPLCPWPLCQGLQALSILTDH